MEMKQLTGTEFRAMVQAGAARLEEHAELVNSLNVFPVPDGDTGTNMTMSFASGAAKVKQSAEETVGPLAKEMTKGLLMGARGNSGVILSQLVRGFSKSVESFETLDAKQFAAAFTRGVETAYKAVMKPVEGTILTVAREAAESGEIAAQQSEDVVAVMRAIVTGAKTSLQRTPDLLPVLKEVGVVDSGGQGLVFVYEGYLEVLSGEKSINDFTHEATHDLSELAHHEGVDVAHAVATEDIEFGYCTEIMVRIGDGKTVEDTFDYETFRNYLNELGDSLLVVADDELIKVHVHTERPGEVMNYGQRFGSLVKIKVDNMRLQHETLLDNQPTTSTSGIKNRYGIIAIAAGEGVHQLFTDIGAHVVINGGQTMNPSTEDIVTAIEQANAEQVIILPNNKNIQMAAEQAASVSDVPTIVVPSKTVPQGLTALLHFNDLKTLEENAAVMTGALQQVVSGQITTAVRDTTVDGISIKEHDFMGIVDGAIVCAHSNCAEATKQTLAQMVRDDSEIVTILVGEEGDTSFAEQLAEWVTESHEDIEVEVHFGGQPVYHYLLAVE